MTQRRSGPARPRVDERGEAFDTYGRLVAEIHMRIGRRETSTKQWLLERGWAAPALYASMTRSEIAGALAASDLARASPLGV